MISRHLLLLRNQATVTRLFALAPGAVFALAAVIPIPVTAAQFRLPTQCSTAAVCSPVGSGTITQFYTDPTGGNRVRATYDIEGNTGFVRQKDDKAIVNFRDFNIGRDNTVRYVRVDENGRPVDGASFSTLNRIYQGSKSIIEGRIEVQPGQNGAIYLINQNGILFSGGTQVNVGTLTSAGLNTANLSTRNDRLFNLGVQVDDETLKTLGLFEARVTIQGGKLFKDGARVDANTLIASALNIKDEDFLSDAGIFNAGVRRGINPIRPAFFWEGSDADAYRETYVELEPGAKLSAQLGGAILLLAPNVKNAGTILTEEGQVALAAGAKVYIAPPDQRLGDVDQNGKPILAEDSPYRGLAGILLEVDPFKGKDSAGMNVRLGGKVLNDTWGEIVAAKGNATLVGLTINQNGRISATTSVNRKGSIRLLARQGAAATTLELDENGAKTVTGGVDVLSAKETGIAATYSNYNFVTVF